MILKLSIIKIYEPIAPASITKILTALMVLEIR